MTKRNLRLLSYARVSDVRGREGPGFISEDEQFSKNRSYCETYDHTVIEEGADLDVSGGVMSRPRFSDFLERVRQGDADGIIVARLNRFARSNVGAHEAIETIEKAGGVLISVDEQLDSSTPAGRFLRSILLAAAEWERERTAEGWITARSSAVERGIHVSRHVPPGYVRTPRAKNGDPHPDRVLVPDPIHADHVRTAFKMAAAGDSNTAIAIYLTDHRVGGGRFLSHRVPRLLANRVYLGEARSGSGIANASAHEPLVDERTFMLAQRQRADGLRPANEGVATAPLAGIVRCAGCRHAMKSQEASPTSRGVYRCPKHSRHGVCAAPATVTKANVENYVIDEFGAHYSDLGFVAQESDEDDGGIEKALEAERGYRDQLENIELRNTIGAADHDRLIAALYRQWQELLVEAQPKPRRAAIVPDGMTLADLVSSLADDPDGMRELLASGIQAVFVRPAASRARNLPIEDRVKVVWADDDPVDIPRRGKVFEPRRFDW
jgi:DNA invertase Pin-like site-specific DNA recombinase